ncbi:hypothetical protein CBS101457_000068 [Exobasidium rhododendri]|nr:hypothetical protein CBS101457_000068 [Exobasidium rhododendri]
MLVSKSIDDALSMIKADGSKVMGLSVGPHATVSVKQYIPRAAYSVYVDAQKAPVLTVKEGIVKQDQKYMIIALDVDAPFVSMDFLGPILHWIQPGFHAIKGEDGSDQLVLKGDDSPFVANYIAPAPPPFSGPHRYMFFLYEQPEEFDGKNFAPADGKELPNTKRIRFDLTQFEKEAKLGPVLASTYFCSN